MTGSTNQTQTPFGSGVRTAIALATEAAGGALLPPANPPISYTGTWAGGFAFSLYNAAVFNNSGFNPNILTATFDDSLTETSLLTLDLGAIQQINGSMNNSFNVLTSMSAPSLVAMTGALGGSYPLATTYSFPLLQYLGQGFTPTLNALTSLSLPSLISVGAGQFTPGGTVLTSVSVPNLQYIGSTIAGMAAATTIDMTSLVTFGGITSTMNSLTSWTLTNLQTITGNVNTTLNALTTLSCPALTSINGTFFLSSSGMTTLSMPLLASVNAGITLSIASVTSLNLNSLSTVAGSWNTTNMSGLSTLSLPALTSISSSFFIGTNATSVSLPLLTTCGSGLGGTSTTATSLNLNSLQNVLVGSLALTYSALTSLSLPAIVSIATFFQMLTPTALTTFSMGSTLKSIGGNFTITGAALNQASVDGILVSLAELDGTNGTTAWSSKTVNLSGGTSATPSATGLAAKATLVARSCTVTTN